MIDNETTIKELTMDDMLREMLMDNNIKGLWDYKDEKWEVLTIPPSEINGISQYNVRKTFPDAEIEALAVSLRELGINAMPVVLDELNEVVSGSRRYQAVVKAELPIVFCLRKNMSKREKLLRSFIENELQVDMEDADRQLFARQLIDEEKMTISEVARAVGRSDGTVRRWLKTHALVEQLQTPEVKEALSKSKGRKKDNTITTSNAIAKTGDYESAMKFVVQSPKILDSTVEGVQKEASRGGLNQYTKTKIESTIDLDQKVQKKGPTAKKYDQVKFYMTKKLYDDIIRVKNVCEKDIASLTVNQLIVKLLEDWVKENAKNKGLML